MIKLTGNAAIEYAQAHEVQLNKYADPIEGAREDITLAEARVIAKEDPSLIWCDELCDYEDFDFTTAALTNIRETGCDPYEDLASLRKGTHTRVSLLYYCLEGADEDRKSGWSDYVDAICEKSDE